MKKVSLFVISIVSIVLISNLGLGSVTAYADTHILQKYNECVDVLLEYKSAIESNLKLTNEGFSIYREIINDLEIENAQLRDNHFKTLTEFRYFLGEVDSQFFQKPQVTIDQQTIIVKLIDSKGNDYHWLSPIETYEELVDYEPTYEYLTLDNGYETYSVVDHRNFVDESFGEIADEIYENSIDNTDFIWEVWFMVSQLTVYSLDIGEDPRYAVETLVRGGGDCEDLVILILDMIKSSSYTKDWEIKLVYMDSDNPENPKNINHVIGYVYDGQYGYHIEATGKPSWEWYNSNLSGWWYDV